MKKGFKRPEPPVKIEELEMREQYTREIMKLRAEGYDCKLKCDNILLLSKFKGCSYKCTKTEGNKMFVKKASLDRVQIKK